MGFRFSYINNYWNYTKRFCPFEEDWTNELKSEIEIGQKTTNFSEIRIDNLFGGMCVLFSLSKHMLLIRSTSKILVACLIAINIFFKR